ncbi:MAG: phosphatidylcholine synthase [Hyphomicrobiaceae bacterium]
MARMGAGMRLAGYAVHLFTALGSVCALLATLAVLDGRFEAAFAWLFVALVIDAVDGTMARAVRVDVNVPRFSGERLDLVIDFVTYVFVPVIALIRGGFLVGTAGMAAAALVLLSSLYHFADRSSKADDHCFVGFPAVWNIVAFCLFAWGAAAWLALAICVVLSLLAFVPMHWIHPMRVKRCFRPSVGAAGAGIAAGLWVLGTGFPGGTVAQIVLGVASAYFVVMAVIWSWLGRGDGLA